MMTLILGSHSPRRAEILRFFSLPFIQMASAFDEESLPFKGDPRLYAMQLAQGKGRELAERFPSSPILTADTVVYRSGKLYGKPRDSKEATQFLNELAGGWHVVWTALCLKWEEREEMIAEETRVCFRALSREQIAAYVAAIPVTDKAGGYMIQGTGSVIVEKIEGCYYNVMGLPMQGLCNLLNRGDIDLWRYLRPSE